MLPALLLALLPAASEPMDLRVRGTELILAQGRQQLSGEALVGLTLELPGLGALRIDSAEPDPGARFPGLWLHQARLRPPGEAAFLDLCEPDGTGDTRLLFFEGDFDDQGHYRSDPDRYSLSCVSGVQAKCLRWGYEPWRQAPLGGGSLEGHFKACLQAARADYCGDGLSATRDGTLIDIYDRVGVQTPEAEPERWGLSFESAWGPGGAICVHHPRIAAESSLPALAARCPRLADRLGTACVEAGIEAEDALLFVRSRPH